MSSVGLYEPWFERLDDDTDAYGVDTGEASAEVACAAEWSASMTVQTYEEVAREEANAKVSL